MAERYYIPKEQAEALEQVLTSLEKILQKADRQAQQHITKLRELIFATPIPEDVAFGVEASLAELAQIADEKARAENDGSGSSPGM